MTISLAGKQDKNRLDFIANNIYALSKEEYSVLPSTLKPDEYILDIKTTRLIDPVVRVIISEDKLSALVSFYPGINNDKKISYKDTVSLLKENYKVSTGYINEKALKKALEFLDKDQIIENILACEGTPPVHGKDAVVEYLFEQPNNKPKILPNGRVDYKEVNKFILVDKDQIIVKKTPHDKGKDGRDITGNVIRAKEGRDKKIDVVEGVYGNSDNTEFRAKYNGHIILNQNTISVLPILYINGDVDMRVGNLRFEGTIHITGNVLSGFIIDGDDIIVEGVVENAELYAKNTINIKRGIKGVLNKGLIRAGGNISIGYCENANIYTAGDLSIEKYCLNSTVEASSITLTDKNSTMSGGVIKAFSHIQVANLGTIQSGKMSVSLGYSPAFQSKAEKVGIEMNQIKQTLQKISNVVSKLNFKDRKVTTNPKVKMLLENAKVIKKRLPLLEKRYKDLIKKSVCDSPKLTISNMVYPGVKLNILDISRNITKEMKNIEFGYNAHSNTIITKAIGK